MCSLDGETGAVVIQFHCLYYSATRLWYEPSKLGPVFAYVKYVFF